MANRILIIPDREFAMLVSADPDIVKDHKEHYGIDLINAADISPFSSRGLDFN